MKNNMLALLRNEIASAVANIQKCQAAYRGFKAFKHDHQGLEFCAVQLQQAAGALRDAAAHLSDMAENLHDAFADNPAQLELDEISMDGRA